MRYIGGSDVPLLGICWGRLWCECVSIHIMGKGTKWHTLGVVVGIVTLSLESIACYVLQGHIPSIWDGMETEIIILLEPLPFWCQVYSQQSSWHHVISSPKQGSRIVVRVVQCRGTATPITSTESSRRYLGQLEPSRFGTLVLLRWIQAVHDMA